MLPIPTPPVPDLLSSLVTHGFRRLSVAEYHAMHAAGILMNGERVELLDGFIVEKPVRHPPHEASLRRLTARLPRQLPEGWFLQIQGAITLPTHSEPEPDGAILRGDETSCDGRLPGPADVVLVIEVSDSSRRFDRREKGMIYARDRLPVYWIINLIDRVVEMYSDPDPTTTPPAYRTRTDYPPGQAVPIVLDSQTVGQIPVDDLLP